MAGRRSSMCCVAAAPTRAASVARGSRRAAASLQVASAPPRAHLRGSRPSPRAPDRAAAFGAASGPSPIARGRRGARHRLAIVRAGERQSPPRISSNPAHGEARSAGELRARVGARRRRGGGQSRSLANLAGDRRNGFAAPTTSAPHARSRGVHPSKRCRSNIVGGRIAEGFFALLGRIARLGSHAGVEIATSWTQMRRCTDCARCKAPCSYYSGGLPKETATACASAASALRAVLPIAIRTLKTVQATCLWEIEELGAWRGARCVAWRGARCRPDAC